MNCPLLYTIVKMWVRLALTIFCRKITWSDTSRTRGSGPLILACNHPDSFLDAIIIGSRFRRPVHFLARGDAFRRPFAQKLLTALKLIPIYRLSEGREYLALNDTSFERCQEILQQEGILLIFSEGLCEHQRGLRPLKKGTARIAFNAWQSVAGVSCEVWPVSLSYNSFNRFGKRVIINFGQPVTARNVDDQCSEGERLNQFNGILADRLKQGIIASAGGDDRVAQAIIANPRASYELSAALITKGRAPWLTAADGGQLVLNIFGLIMLFIPAIIGWLLNVPGYWAIRNFTRKKTRGTVFYDSVLFGLLMVAYPLYWILINVVGIILLKTTGDICQLLGTGTILLMPLWAWLYLVWKDCLNRVINYTF